MTSARAKELLDLFEKANSDAGLADSLTAYFAKREIVASVLGVDIYKYSSFPPNQQRLVPVVFQDLCDETAKDCLDTESAIFSESDFTDRFIATGDGGFFILDTPLHALVFACYFQANLSAYNGGLWRRRLRDFVGPLTVRYAVTRDSVFRLDDNWFGAGIINNARILSRDTLNRCLCDRNSLDWFDERIGTFESLQLVSRSMLADITKRSEQPDATSIVFPHDRQTDLAVNAIRTLSTQKIGSVSAKTSVLDIYNLYAQVVLAWSYNDENRPLMVTVGNLNPSGVS